MQPHTLGAPVAGVPDFVAARADGGGSCVQPGAVDALLSELRAQPLFQVPEGDIMLCC